MAILMQIITNPKVEHYSQGDNLWKKLIMGRWKTIGQSGCAVTSLSMLVNYLSGSGGICTPMFLDKWLDRNGGYSGDLIVWSKITELLMEQNITVLLRDNRRPAQFHNIITSKIDSNMPLIGGVSYGSPSTIQNHWVVITGWSSETGIEYYINDPATKSGSYNENPCDDNILQKTTRQGGYHLNRIIYYDRVS